VILFDPSRHIQQSKQNPLRTHSQEIAEITTDPLPVINRREFGIPKLRNLGLYRVADPRRAEFQGIQQSARGG